MSDQIRLLPGEDPDELIARAKTEHKPIRTCEFRQAHLFDDQEAA